MVIVEVISNLKMRIHGASPSSHQRSLHLFATHITNLPIVYHNLLPVVRASPEVRIFTLPK
jgi:hypothetical protein